MATDTTAQKEVKLQNNSGKEYGKSGTLIYGGTITGEEYNLRLYGRRGALIFDEMRRSDSDVQELLKACKLPIKTVTWKVESAGDSDDQKYQQRFIENELFNRNISFPSLLSDILTMYDFGFSLFEKVFELTEFEKQVRIGIKKLASRKQYSVLFWQQEGGQEGVTQQVAGEVLSIPQEKLMLFTNDREGDNYEGISLLRYVYRDWYAKKNLMNMHLVALERMGMGIPILIPPASPDPKDVAKARQALRKMRLNQEAYIELPAGWEVSMMDMKGHETKDILPTLQYLGGNIKKSGLAGFLELGSRNNGGSRAVSQDHSQLFEKSLEATANVIASVINEHLIQQLRDFNFSDMSEGYPKLTFGNIGDEDLKEIGQYLRDLAAEDLITPDADLENHLRQIARLPDLPEEYEDDYNDRILNARAIRNTQLDVVGNSNPGQSTGVKKVQPKGGALPTDNANKTAVRNLPSDAHNKTVAVKDVRASALEEAEASRQKLIEVLFADEQ